jgi:hypothetical protein
MWKHDQNNIIPPSAMMAANCRFKGSNFNLQYRRRNIKKTATKGFETS